MNILKKLNQRQLLILLSKLNELDNFINNEVIKMDGYIFLHSVRNDFRVRGLIDIDFLDVLRENDIFYRTHGSDKINKQNLNLLMRKIKLKLLFDE